MIEKLLANCLEPIFEAEGQLRRRRVVTALLLTGAIGFLILFALSMWADWWSWKAVFGLIGGLAILAVVGLIRAGREPDMRALAQKVEEHHPDLQAALLAAMDQKPGPDGELSFLQSRLLSEISEHAVRNQWVRKVSHRRLVGAAWGQFAALVAFCASVWFLLGAAPGAAWSVADLEADAPPSKEGAPAAIAISVSPGDVELEKGSRLVIEASFAGRSPASAMVQIKTKDGERKIPMTVGLDDSVFSALLPKVDLGGTYQISYEAESSDEFAISLFEYPVLSQADALITPPAFLKKDPEEIIDTRKITVMEGSEIQWKLRVNKPLAMAELFGEDQVSIPLTADPKDPTLLLATHIPTETQRYRVHLIDDADRSNKRPPWLTVNVKRNEPPELKLTFPGRDFEVSAVQELPVEAEAWDDVQIENVGFSYQFGEEEKSFSLSETPLAGGKKHSLLTQIDVEKLGAEPRELITYYLWAEDRDNEGNLRRTTSDMFFAEVRFFEEIIREGQPQQGKGEGQGDAAELLKLQKEIINAAWKLRRYHDLGREFETLIPDLEVVQESQTVVMAMVDPVLAKLEDAELKQIYTDAKALMEKAANEFASVLTERNGDLISPAHQTARAVFAKLIEARSREQEISMSKSESSSSSQQQQQRNMNLELKQKELKYEEQSKAQEEQQTAEQKENLAVLSRLKELARRQEAIAEKIKELENQLQDADEEEKAEIERQLKRLQEEQRELLREVDDLSERMDSEENRANMSEEREKLEETREDIQETSEKLESGDLADAANSATRAQRELEEMEEEFRERTSRKFSDEMRDIRDSARQLSENQKSISEELEKMAGADDGDPFASDNQTERAELAQSISNQAREFSDMIEEMKKLSEEAESSEPILSDALYEAVRNSTMNGVEDSLGEARDYTFYNRPNQALGPEQAAARGIEELKENVEAAAEKVLGNEADALRLARSELDRLIDQTKEESKRLAGDENEAGESAPQEGDGKELAESGQKGSPGKEGETPGAGEGQPKEGEGEQGKAGQAKDGQQASQQPGSGEKGQQQGDSKGKGESPNGEGESPGKGKSQMAGKGEQPGKGESPSEGQGKEGGKGEKGSLAQKGQQPGKGKGPGQEGSGKGDQPGEQPGQKGKGDQPGDGQEGQGEQNGKGQQVAANGSRQSRGSLSLGGDDRGSGQPSGGQVAGQPLFFNQQSEQREAGPITGEDYKEFRDKLGNIEEMLQQEDLRNSVARVADNARAMRVDFSRDNLPPGAASIEQKITEPLVELRQRISEEIAKLNKENPIAPIDRDPVPSEFRDLVRRYYEELGAGK